MNPIIWAIISMILIGLADFTVKLGMNNGQNGVAIFLYSAILMVILVALYAYFQKIPLKINSDLLSFSIFNGILLSAGTIAILLALRNGEASVIIAIGRLSLIITVLCAFIFLKEKVTIEKIAGVVCAIGSIYLLTK